MENSKVGQFIKQKRIDKGITQQTLADELYVDVTTVSKWERGVTFPDSGIVTRLCSILNINEHELFQACEDQDYRYAKAKLNKISKGKSIAFYIISGCYALAVLICFICNLAVNHTLSWFFIVFTSCLCGWTFFPTCMRFVKNNRIEWFVGSTFLSMTLLFLTCSMYTSNYWCFVALTGTLLGYFAFFFPFIFYKRDWSLKIRKYFTPLYFSVLFCLTLALLVVIDSYISIDMKLGIAVTSYCFAPVLVGALLALIPVNKLLRASFITFSSGIFAVGLNGILNHYLGPTGKDYYKINFADWNNYSDGNTTFIIGACALLTSIVLFTIGIIKNNRLKQK